MAEDKNTIDIEMLGGDDSAPKADLGEGKTPAPEKKRANRSKAKQSIPLHISRIGLLLRERNKGVKVSKNAEIGLCAIIYNLAQRIGTVVKTCATEKKMRRLISEEIVRESVETDPELKLIFPTIKSSRPSIPTPAPYVQSKKERELARAEKLRKMGLRKKEERHKERLEAFKLKEAGVEQARLIKKKVKEEVTKRIAATAASSSSSSKKTK